GTEPRPARASWRGRAHPPRTPLTEPAPDPTAAPASEPASPSAPTSAEPAPASSADGSGAVESGAVEPVAPPPERVARRLFFRQFAGEVVHSAVTVVGMAGAFQRQS